MTGRASVRRPGRFTFPIFHRRAVLTLLCVAASVASLSACDRCGSPEARPIGTLSEIHGDTVERDSSSQREHWQTAPLGAAFHLGDGVRTGLRAAAVIAMADDSELQLRQSTTVRFLVDGAGADEQAFDVRTGDALLIAGARITRLRTHVGLATVAPGTQVTLARHGDTLEYRVDIGEVSFRGPNGAFTVQAGENLEIGIGLAVLRRWSATPARGEVVAPSDAVRVADAAVAVPESEDPVREPSHPAGKDAARTEDDIATGPEYSHMGAVAGESFTVHTADLPVAVAFDFQDKCAGEGEVVSGNQRSRAAGRANLLLNAGARPYQVRCVDPQGGVGRRVVAHGTVRVLRDAGTRKLPPRAPTSFIEADGRAYTVYYQNQLPDVSVSWPNAPHANHYQLTIDGKSTTTDSSEHLFRSGSLYDGVHQVSFSAGERRSRATAFEIKFDNAAPKASLSSPIDRGFSAGDTVKIEGVALPMWKVSIEGGTIAVDADERFSGQVVTNAAHPDIAVRLRHPRLGTHYYLRRAATSP
jgi:hypothetical protein